MSRVPDLPPMDGDALLRGLRSLDHPMPQAAADELASLRARLAEVEGERDEALSTLDQIANWTLSQPAALNMPDAAWYRNQATSMVGLAAHTLAAARKETEATERSR